MTRRTLTQKRASEIIEFDHDRVRYTACVSRFDDGSIGEVFLDVPKASMLADYARDMAVAASLALQFGCPAEVLRRAVTRSYDGSAAGPLGCLLDLVENDHG